MEGGQSACVWPDAKATSRYGSPRHNTLQALPSTPGHPSPISCTTHHSRGGRSCLLTVPKMESLTNWADMGGEREGEDGGGGGKGEMSRSRSIT